MRAARRGARHTGKRNVAMETTMATLNQYTRRGVGSFVRLLARSAGRSVTQAKSPRGPIGHVRERLLAFPTSKYLLPLLPSPLSTSSTSSNPDLAVIPLLPLRHGIVFSFGVLPSADMPAFGVTLGEPRWKEVSVSILARYVDTCGLHVGKEGRKGFTLRESLLNQTRSTHKRALTLTEKNGTASGDL